MSLRSTRLLFSHRLHVVRREVHIVSQTDFSHACHRFSERDSRKELLLIGTCYRIEKGLVQLR